MLAVVSAALFLVVVDMTVLNVALPVLARELNATNAEKLWMVNTYSLVLAGLLPGCGTLSDRIGHRKVFTAGLVIFGLASVMAAFAPSSGWLIFARGVLAVGAAMMLPATISIIRLVFTEDKERAVAIGIWGRSPPVLRRWDLSWGSASGAFLVGIGIPYQRAGGAVNPAVHIRSDPRPSRKCRATLGFTHHGCAYRCADIFPVCNKKRPEEQHQLG